MFTCMSRGCESWQRSKVQVMYLSAIMGGASDMGNFKPNLQD